MLYYLSLFSSDISFLNLFRYITFRSGGALVTAFLIMLCFGSRFIGWLKKKQGEGQPIREDGPQTHFAKKGTPCMGGLLLLIAVLVSSLFWAQLSNPYVWVLIFVMSGFGLAGFVDDYKKLTKHNSKGISGRQKLFVQFVISLIACLWLICLENVRMPLI